MRTFLVWVVRKVLTRDDVSWVDSCGCLRSPDAYGTECPTEHDPMARLRDCLRACEDAR